MSNIPEKLKFAGSHEWVCPGADGVATVGISDFAQKTLGDIVFVELPVPGTRVSAKDEVAVVESVKSASDIYSPVSGEILEVNELLQDAPEMINASPLEKGWLYKLKLSDENELEQLLDAAAYAESCQ
ncbi:MAG: glycine cleavage system protein GcvH [Pseudohongiellaceae bacterium]